MIDRKRPVFSFGFSNNRFNDIACIRKLAQRLGMSRPVISVYHDGVHPTLVLNDVNEKIYRSVILKEFNDCTVLYFSIFCQELNHICDEIYGEDEICNFIFYGDNPPIHVYTVKINGDIQYKKVSNFGIYNHLYSPIPGIIQFRSSHNQNLENVASVWFYKRNDEFVINMLNSNKKIRHAKVKYYKSVTKENQKSKYTSRNSIHLKQWLSTFGYSKNTVSRLLISVLYPSKIYTIQQFKHSNLTLDQILCMRGVGKTTAYLYFDAKKVCDKLNK